MARQSAKATRAELERRLKEIRAQEEKLKSRIHKLECSIVAAPGLEVERRIRWRDTVPPDEEMVAARRKKAAPVRATRIQAEAASAVRVRQAVTALGLILLLCVFAWWFCNQVIRHGLLTQ